MFINGSILYATLHRELKKFFRENYNDFTFSNIDTDFGVITNMSYFNQCLC